MHHKIEFRSELQATRAELFAELRATNQGIDGVSARLDTLHGRVDTVIDAAGD